MNASELFDRDVKALVKHQQEIERFVACWGTTLQFHQYMNCKAEFTPIFNEIYDEMKK
jgi:hypothetical protein